MNRRMLGLLIKSLRQAHHLSQSIFADSIDVNQSTVSRVEKGDENITIEIYSQCLSAFSIHTDVNDPSIDTTFHELLDGCLNNDGERVKENHRFIQTRGSYSIHDFFYSRVAQGFYYSFFDHYNELESLSKFLDHFHFIYTAELELYCHMIHGYHFLHQQKHRESMDYFQKAYEIMVSEDLKVPTLLIIYALNNISLQQFSTAKISLNSAFKVVQNGSYAFYTLLKHLGTQCVFAGDYRRTIIFLTICEKNQAFLNSTFYFSQQVNYYLGIAHYMTGAIEESLNYFNRSIQSDRYPLYTAFSFCFILHILRNRNDRNGYEEVLRLLKNHQLYQDEAILNLVNDFFDFNGFNLDGFLKDYEQLEETIFKKPTNLVFVRFLMTNFSKHIWSHRKYKLYKSFFDLILHSYFGQLNQVL